ncbi:MAG: Fe2+-dependent dioxygenase [Planctomycetota bacterium]|jgi:PKHD-type hydroxylase|nr:MAG: Fe2+-dependent dioxygenase [Planctomycetota bacterium]
MNCTSEKKAMLTIPDLLLPNEIVEINAMLDVAEYDDGRTTAKGIAIDVKSNRQVSRRWTKVAALDAILETALRRSRLFREVLSPSAYSPAIYSKYLAGDGYGPHVDAVMSGMPPMRQDVSMTIFLSPNDSYTGGELCLHHCVSGKQIVKLPAGSAFAYPTNVVHEVLPVESGERRVAVLWIQSFFRDSDIREMVADLRRCVETAKAIPLGDPLAISKVLGNLERKFIST